MEMTAKGWAAATRAKAARGLSRSATASTTASSKRSLRFPLSTRRSIGGQR